MVIAENAARDDIAAPEAVGNVFVAAFVVFVVVGTTLTVVTAPTTGACVTVTDVRPAAATLVLIFSISVAGTRAAVMEAVVTGAPE